MLSILLVQLKTGDTGFFVWSKCPMFRVFPLRLQGISKILIGEGFAKHQAQQHAKILADMRYVSTATDWMGTSAFTKDAWVENKVIPQSVRTALDSATKKLTAF